LCYRLAEILQVSNVEIEGELTMQALKRGAFEEALKSCKYVIDYEKYSICCGMTEY
jgi:hypothetical protein